MHLKKLDIFGFKSFAHKITLEFGPGITCVVGPNGCGKTNVADAIRWVLGEQSASELRGSSMADVIFNGTKTRRRLGMAEVTLSIDNSEGYLPTDYSEVAIGRRVFRSGESEYSINKEGCRLRDVKDLFLDTGIGSRTYSLIERKMVDSVLSDSTGHRRFMFEEAAGIMKYRVRKRSTLNKLAAAETDMQRVSDIISEVEKQVRSLKRQLAQARRHRRYSDDLKRLEVALGRWEYARWGEQRGESGARAQELRSSLQSATASLQNAERSSSAVRAELRDKEEALSTLQLEVGELDARVRDLAETLLVARERRSASDRRVHELNTELTDLRADLSLSLKRAADLEDAMRETATRVQESEANLERRSSELADVEKEYRRVKQALDAEKQTRLEGLESSAGTKGELESYRTRIDDLTGEHVQLERSLAETRAALAAGEEKILRVLDDEKRLLGAASAARVAEKERVAELDHAREALLTAREARGRLAGELEAGKHKLALLSEIRDGYGGFAKGVRSLLSNPSHGIRGLVGTVADVLDVEPEMSGAIEAALGTAAQFVVTDNVGAARSAMGHLSSDALGRATFLPVSDLSRVSASELPAAVISDAAVLGPASRFVRADGHYSVLIDILLEGTAVVRDMDAALRLAAAHHGSGLAFVTPQGDMATSKGVLTGGKTASEEAGLLRRAQRVEAAERDVESLRKRLAAAEDDERAATQALAEAGRTGEAAEESTQRAESELWEMKRVLAEHELAKTTLSEKTAQLAANRDALAARIDGTRKNVEGLATRLAQLSKGEDELGERLHELEHGFRSAERKRRRAAEEEKQAELEAAAARSALTQLRGEHAQLGETARSARASIDRKTEEREGHLTTVTGLDEQIEKDAAALGELNSEKSTLEAERDAMKASADALKARIETLESDARGSRDGRDATQQELHEREIKETELKGRCEALRERLREDYSLDVETLGDLETKEGEEPFNAAKARENVDRLRARLRSMGPVNLLALEEYDEENKRLEFLQAQYDDLYRSKQALKQAIEQINKTATKMFVETFELVRTNFIDTFQRLFQGGEADLRLLDAEDPLESAIEIVASPRGKRLGRLSLLSGGERALTAIALLFAIYLVKPSPFCILDEVDAPLDDANVERFINMLREFSSRTQFVIITHNKATMQSADRLYGITMEESGVSKVVSVRLDAVGTEVGIEEAAHQPA
ncbi:MAG: chromosome segregation protein SMC [Candidatus Eisenbacteria bacterium]